MKKKMHSGGKNLVILGVVSTLIAVVTTVVSLLIYHNSGDIYLDRSRPGFLPDEEEIEEETAENEEDYNFDKTGALSVKVLEEYLTKLKAEVEAVDVYEKPFDVEVLSDDTLGIAEVGEKMEE